MRPLCNDGPEVVTLRFAQRHPEFVRRIVFCGAAKRHAEIYTDAVPRLSRALERGEIDEVAGGAVRPCLSNPEAGRVRKQRRSSTARG
ncbi:hypothetical protein ACIGO6_01700 [Streptomyces sp. NPDC053750]|uniref:hypothetical protein n=1 Tax=Streptomyces sp. NPDC053750 TaxID=3365714 RepID=UPI0037D912E3